MRIPHRAKIDTLSFGRGEKRSLADEDLGFYVYDLPTPLAAGTKRRSSSTSASTYAGFTNGGNRTDIVDNGTFFNSDVAPHIGYMRRRRAEPRRDRHKFGLDPRDRPRRETPRGRCTTTASPDATG
jgi:ABC-2 type transport system permease protein